MQPKTSRYQTTRQDLIFQLSLTLWSSGWYSNLDVLKSVSLFSTYLLSSSPRSAWTTTILLLVTSGRRRLGKGAHAIWSVDNYYKRCEMMIRCGRFPLYHFFIRRYFFIAIYILFCSIFSTFVFVSNILLESSLLCHCFFLYDQESAQKSNIGK